MSEEDDKKQEGEEQDNEGKTKDQDSGRKAKTPEEQLERLRQELAETKSEAQNLRKKYRDEQKERTILAERWKENEDAKLKEDGKYKDLFEKKEKEVQETQERLKAAEEAQNHKLIRAELRGAARAAGLIDFDFLDKIPVEDIKITADGDISGVEEAVEKYKEKKPYLFKKEKEEEVDDKKPKEKTPKPTGGAGAPPLPGGKTNSTNARDMEKPERKKALNNYLGTLKGLGRLAS